MAILTAYGLVNFRFLTIDDAWYLVLNLSGAIAIALEASVKHDRQPAVLNIVWALVAAVALVRVWMT